MKKNAAFRHWFKIRPYAAVLAVAALLPAVFVSAASAATPIGKDGVIHACYRVKGKPKGSLRVVRSARAHCRRGERKVAWALIPAGGVDGQSGQGGQSGASGQGGQGGAAGRSGEGGMAGAPGPNEAALEAKVASLTLKVESLEGLLKGVNVGDLSSLPGKVNGIESLLSDVEVGDLSNAVDTLGDVTKQKLEDAVEGFPALEGACAQTEELTERSNALLGFIESLDTLHLLNNLPQSLPSFENTCPGT
jgi:hypothetical protein